MQNPAADQVVRALTEANNVMVTVKNGPSVDELTAAIGLTLILNHMGKHAITVFSGRVPSTIEFLQPETAIDTNTDSLRDFIIALDKSKADKLRYKVEDNVVRIFITPYKTSISDRDLEFSQGDFNVDVVVALGVVTKDDFDQAVTVHGRILHDATVVTLTKQNVMSQIGAINWQEQYASSISEMVASITDMLGENVLDGQIATALMTGIVSETDRFRNANTTPEVLTISAKLMSAGANQQLIAERLEQPDVAPAPTPATPIPEYDAVAKDDGTLEIRHDEAEDELQRIHIDEHGNLGELPPSAEYPSAMPPQMPPQMPPVQSMPPMEAMPAPGPMMPPVTSPLQQESMPEGPVEDEFTSRSYLRPLVAPRMYATDDGGGVNTESVFAQSQASPAEAMASPLTPPLESPAEQAAHRKKVIQPLEAEIVQPTQPQEPEFATPGPIEQPVAPPPIPTPAETAPVAPEPVAPTMPEPAPAAPTVPAGTQTLAELEQSVKSPHVESTPSVDDFLGTTRVASIAEPAKEETTSSALPPVEVATVVQEDKPEVPEELQAPPEVIDANAPPAVPPPLMPQGMSQPQFFDADGKNNNPFLNPNQ